MSSFHRCIKSVRQVYVVVSVSITYRKYSCSNRFMLQLIQLSMGHTKIFLCLISYIWHSMLISLLKNSVSLSVTTVSGSPNSDIQKCSWSSVYA